MSTEPSLSLALALRPCVAGAWAEVPSAGEVSVTIGAAFNGQRYRDWGGRLHCTCG